MKPPIPLPSRATPSDAGGRISHARWSDAQLRELAMETGEMLRRVSMLLVSAESCTGGLVAKLVTDIAGSSEWFDRSYVTYTNTAKQEMLGVSAHVLNEVGAVSEEVVLAMASGALERSRAGVSVALSGIAGPGGATPGKPVGTVWIAWGFQFRPDPQPALMAQCFHFGGDRDTVRCLAAQYALHGIIQRLNAHSSKRRNLESK